MLLAYGATEDLPALTKSQRCNVCKMLFTSSQALARTSCCLKYSHAKCVLKNFDQEIESDGVRSCTECEVKEEWARTVKEMATLSEASRTSQGESSDANSEIKEMDYKCYTAEYQARRFTALNPTILLAQSELIEEATTPENEIAGDGLSLLPADSGHSIMEFPCCFRGDVSIISQPRSMIRRTCEYHTSPYRGQTRAPTPQNASADEDVDMGATRTRLTTRTRSIPESVHSPWADQHRRARIVQQQRATVAASSARP